MELLFSRKNCLKRSKKNTEDIKNRKNQSNKKIECLLQQRAELQKMGEAAKEKLSSENLFSCQFVPSESDFDKVWMIWEALEYVKNHWNNEFSSEGAFRDMADDMYGVVRAGEYFKSLGKMGEKIRNQQDERAKEALEKAYQSKKEVDEILKDPSIYDVGKIEDALKKFSDDVENVRSEREHLEKNRF